MLKINALSIIFLIPAFYGVLILLMIGALPLWLGVLLPLIFLGILCAMASIPSSFWG
jgi:hypothetical protein